MEYSIRLVVIVAVLLIMALLIGYMIILWQNGANNLIADFLAGIAEFGKQFGVEPPL